MTRYLRERALFDPLIEDDPADDLNLVIVIPAKDESDLLVSLESLRQCDPPRRSVEVIVVINASESDSAACVERNATLASDAQAWAAGNSSAKLRFHVLLHQQLPKKHAGVGLARKIGMDEGCRRLETAGNPQGVLVCFDADSRCDPNYLVEIETLFHCDEACQACSIYYEHPIAGDEFPPDIYDAITLYELHLRYYVHVQRWAGFPLAIQTIGSSMAARCDAYQAQNGMNRRKAGEDFYFLHKFTPLGQVAELTTTRVIPSPRVSDRVPFGTGKAVGDWIDSPDLGYQSYSPRSFEDLRRFLDAADDLFGLVDSDSNRSVWMSSLPPSITSWLDGQPFWPRIEEIRANVTTAAAFRSRFFRWFNAFQVMKFVHHARDHFHSNESLVDGARWLLKSDNSEAQQLLGEFRDRDRSTGKI